VRRRKPDEPESADEALDEVSCRERAVGLLARREHSRGELTRKLAARGFDEDVVAATLARLEREGALADGRFTASFIRTRAAKGKGPVRIRAELAERGM
jgi:regulatory protein